MGQRKRPDQRHGHPRQAGGHGTVDEIPRPDRLHWPDPGPDWHPYARRWYLSLAESGQAIDYTPSDVWTAVVLAEDLSRELNFPDQPIGATKLAAWLSGCGDLLATAAHRRRVRMELERPRGEHEQAHRGAVASLAARRKGPEGPA